MKTTSLLLLVLVLLSASTCHKKIEEPPVGKPADIRPNLSIRQLRSQHFAGGFEKILNEYVVSGLVVANDSSGNFYKTIVVQDSTGGISVKLDATGLYASYPVGRKIALKLKDLWLGDYANMIQLGAGVDRSDPQYPELIAIPQPLINRHIIAGSYGNPLRPIPVTIEQLGDSLQSCLVRISDIELPASDTGKTYADAPNRVSANRTVQACNGARVSLRTSGFAGFAGVRTPRGNGQITAVYSVFRNEKQLMLRDTADMQLKGLRCAAAGIKLLLSEDFETRPPDSVQIAKNWKNIAEAGNRLFQRKTNSGNGYAEIGAFATGQPTVGSWLISPPVNLTGSANEQLQFMTRDGFDNGATLQVLVSTNYDGSAMPWKSKWVPLKAQVAKGTVNNLATSWVWSGNISLDNYKSIVYIAFRYDGADPAMVYDKRTTRFQLDNIRILGN
ncbi:DUF5689 domain-containing protein [Sediminibacterium soli]|uniref:DUF5689 domain-containing protein n=1 Tax=Sediminibacterium soli TaxID=2698829 RepID=UPI001379A6DA|nr:DUF5689 domain-containing protein [Sediminibacterium soli]NCI47164.1 hypothetical protein [Sediminibacterium soli]